MRLGDGHDPHSAPGRLREHAVDVPRRIHDHRGAGPAGQVAAVAQPRRLQGVDKEHG
ncbi:hypothetical protein [Streptomyces sp. NBC_00019]|uniref:hypothetical protein n=1 Tax=Streptomyces sp. NBC_00019 TaxID=2975623 RepID=UPI003252D65D